MSLNKPSISYSTAFCSHDALLALLNAHQFSYQFLNELYSLQRDKLENICGIVLREEMWTPKDNPIRIGCLPMTRPFKASYVGSELSPEDLVSIITGENPKNCDVFQKRYSSIAQLDIPNFLRLQRKDL